MDELNAVTQVRGGSPARRLGGMTLVEILIAMLILAGGLLSMASVQIQSLQGGQRGRHLTQASILAASQIEQLQRVRWSNLPATSWTAPVGAAQVLRRADPDQTYAISWRVTTLVPNATRAIDVRVTWTEATGRARSVTMSSIRQNHEAL